MKETFSTADIAQNKVKAGLGYLVFFLPLILCRGSKLGRFCANQGLILWIVSLLASALLGIFTMIPLFGLVFVLLARLVRFLIFVVGLICFFQLLTNDYPVEVPFVGMFRLIK